jgi:hypothetical protein
VSRRTLWTLTVAAVAAAAATGTATADGPSAVTSADSKPPTQTIFASSKQRANRLYLLITVHETGRLSVSGTAGKYRYRGVRKRVVQHIPNKVYLSLSGGALRAVRSALKRRSVTATVRSRGTDKAGNSRTYTKRIKLRR